MCQLCGLAELPPFLLLPLRLLPPAANASRHIDGHGDAAGGATPYCCCCCPCARCVQVDQIMHIMYAAVHSGIPYVEDYYYQVRLVLPLIPCTADVLSLVSGTALGVMYCLWSPVLPPSLYPVPVSPPSWPPDALLLARLLKVASYRAPPHAMLATRDPA